MSKPPLVVPADIAIGSSTQPISSALNRTGLSRRKNRFVAEAIIGGHRAVTSRTGDRMQYVCDAPDGKTWFRLESEAEAELESEMMRHAVAKHYRRNQQQAERSYRPVSSVSFEQNIGLKAHFQREMALFLTLRNREGEGLATAMLPPGGCHQPAFQCIIVGPDNSDPYDEHAAAIQALAAHFGLRLERRECYPYKG